jgi:hypothetical protein
MQSNEVIIWSDVCIPFSVQIENENMSPQPKPHNKKLTTDFLHQSHSNTPFENTPLRKSNVHEKLNAVLFPGLVELLKVADKKGVINAAGGRGEDDFDPIDFIARYLMRHNPNIAASNKK